MAALRDLLPVVARGEYDETVRERDDWERRARLAAERARDAQRTVVPPAARRSVFALVIAGMWLVIIGVFVGGAVIPHHDDRPTLASSADLAMAFTQTGLSHMECADAGRAASVASARMAFPTSCRSARARLGGWRKQSPRQPRPD